MEKKPGLEIQTDKDGQWVVGQLGAVYPECFAKVKEDVSRYICIREVGKCPHENVCYRNLQIAIRDLFTDRPELVGGRFGFSSDIARFETKILAKNLIHSVYKISSDPYSPVEK
jgi:hypothetical protein